MKMKYIKTFEKFEDDFGRFSDEEEQGCRQCGYENEFDDEFNDNEFDDDQEFDDEEFSEFDNEEEFDEFGEDELGEEDGLEDEDDELNQIKRWGDEDENRPQIVESRKVKKDDIVKAAKEKAKKITKEECKDGKCKGKCKCDEKEKDKKETKGLTAAQKKLPEGLRKAIEAKNKKKK